MACLNGWERTDLSDGTVFITKTRFKNFAQVQTIKFKHNIFQTFIGSLFENIKFSLAAFLKTSNCNICKSKNSIFMQFASKCEGFQIHLAIIHWYFCVPFFLVNFFHSGALLRGVGGGGMFS